MTVSREVGVTELNGSIAVVTGAARGIGRAVRLGLPEAGASRAAADRAWDGAEATRREFEATGRAMIVTFDLNDANAVAIARDRALDRFGRVDILVNNAALRMRDLFFPAGLSTVLDAKDSDEDEEEDAEEDDSDDEDEDEDEDGDEEDGEDGDEEDDDEDDDEEEDEKPKPKVKTKRKAKPAAAKRKTKSKDEDDDSDDDGD